jgi:hypothetical protein
LIDKEKKDEDPDHCHFDRDVRRDSDHSAMRDKSSDRDCTLACTKGGTAYALVSSGKIYPLAGHDADLKTHAGHTVKLTGELKGDTIRVSKIEMPNDAK